MPSVNPSTAVVACPKCGAEYSFPPTMAGKRGRCAKCGQAFTVPSVAKAPEPPREMPQYIGVECHLCGTRMYGGPEQIGKELKCPDCGARTVLPPPPPPKAKNIPAAMEGDQYELWEPDVKPDELTAHLPKYIAVACTRCGTLMYATENQIGQSIACPDCGRKNSVVATQKAAAKSSPLASDAETPALDPATAPTTRPSALSAEVRRKIYEEERDSEYGRALEKSRRTGKPMEIDVRGRPILPRWPLLSGVVPFLFSKGVPARIVGVAAAFFVCISIVIFGIQMASSGGLGAVGGMCIFALGCALTMVCASITFSMFLTIVAASSDGAKEIQEWPIVFDWFGDFFAFAVAAVMSAFPGWPIAKLFPEEPVQTVAFGASMVIFFPLALLSQLDIGSMWGILSPRILKSLLKCPFSWLTFYVETGTMAAACVVATRYAAQQGLNPMIAAAPLGAITLFLYARLLGRLGWRLAEAMPEKD
jgi:DNA-directed RNA polymerase subunit RPC12/RpoP